MSNLKEVMSHFKTPPDSLCLCFQVKGHLDYMRQMDTILVAVGVPTKEVPEASFVLPQSVKVTERTVDGPNQTPEEQHVSGTESPTETPTHDDGAGLSEAENAGDGWDIPDISDLLDSLGETGSVPNDAPLLDDEDAADNETSSGRGGAEDPDDEQVSWSWNDTNWTKEHPHKSKHPK